MSGASLTDEFEKQRRYLRALAYRMLGIRSEAEDVVQDAWLRWAAADRAQVVDPRAFLSRTVTRLCLDRIKSAQARHEIYIGPWLPEPLVDDCSEFQPGPEAAHELANDLSIAFMITLEKLSPLERAAFLLHDVFDMDFSQVATALDRSEAACRQLAARARVNVKSNRPPVPVPAERERLLATAFIEAARGGDVAALAAILADDVTFVADGGGRVLSVPRVLVGRDKIAKVWVGFQRLQTRSGTVARMARINGLPGFVLSAPDGAIVQTVALDVNDEGLIGAIYVTRNPDKLRNVACPEKSYS